MYKMRKAIYNKKFCNLPRRNGCGKRLRYTCSFKNKPAKAKKLKRQMNRRYRKMQEKIMEEEFAIL